MATSMNISHKPLFSRKHSDLCSFFLPDKYAEIPARKTKVGAQKCNHL
jgi:hypothetical protein